MKNKEFPRNLVLLFLIAVTSIFIIGSNFIYSWSAGPNYENVTIRTIVNITQSRPTILSIVVDEASDNITLNAGLTRTVICNLTVRDWNGWNDVIGVNATFWDNNSVSMSNSDDENNHYTNATCTNTGNDGNYISYWDCAFDILYYANNGSNWICNSTVIDNYNFTDTAFNTTTINPLYALNVTTQIDYGDLAVEDTSTSRTANVTNFGNMAIDVSIYGYGGTNFETGNGLAFICQIGNITVDNERYSTDDIAWASMTQLTNESATISGLTLPQRTDLEVVNITYWKLYVPPNPYGECNGTIVFAAELP
ncbi:MAG: hypothetical protein ABIC91_02665 [Nanoarchaeota archaeon]